MKCPKCNCEEFKTVREITFSAEGADPELGKILRRECSNCGEVVGIELINGDYILAPLYDTSERFPAAVVTLCYDPGEEENSHDWVDVEVPLSRLTTASKELGTLCFDYDLLDNPAFKKLETSEDPIDKGILNYIHSKASESLWDLLYQLWNIKLSNS